MFSLRSDLRLGNILMEQDVSTASALMKAWKKKAQSATSASLQEMKDLDHICMLGLGEGLTAFIPSYFSDGPKVLRPGHLKDLLGAGGVVEPPLKERRMLRLVADREKSGGAFVGYLISRIRCMDAHDPAHILWRVCILALKAAGLSGRASNPNLKQFYCISAMLFSDQSGACRVTGVGQSGQIG